MSERKYNKTLFSGVILTIIGLCLLAYSVYSYFEVKSLENRIDFITLEDNQQISTSDKYYQHLDIADFLTKKLKQNKRLLIKNSSCIYLDYAQHNILDLYKLIFKGGHEDSVKKDVVEGNINSLYTMLDHYGSCKQTSNYQSELKLLLEEIKHSQELERDSQDRMNIFMNRHAVQTQVPLDENGDYIIDENAYYYPEEIPPQTPQIEPANKYQTTN